MKHMKQDIQAKEEYFKKGGVTTFALTSQIIDDHEWIPCILQERQKNVD